MSRLKLLSWLSAAIGMAAVLAVGLPLTAGHAEPSAADAVRDAWRLSGPLTHDNLAIYFVRGESRPGPVPLTLQEGLVKQAVEVRETGSVTELQMMNTGDDAVYVQAGDIVKGGRQDRVLTVSMLLSPHSGIVAIPVFCVEHDRWTGRAGESAARFESASELLPSRDAKMAMRGARDSAERDSAGAGRTAADARPAAREERRRAADSVHERQVRVWNGVAAIQGDLSARLGKNVASARSRSSLQLALEDDDLRAKQAEFVKSLEESGKADSGIIGYVVVINGRLNSAEIYPSNGLFLKMWPMLLRASATEAIKDRAIKDQAAKDGAGEKPLPTTAEVMAFLGDVQAAQGVDQDSGPAVKMNVKETTGAAMFESRPAAAAPAQWINRSYLAR
jgi:hypothetical protein